MSCKINQNLFQNYSKIQFFPHGPMGYPPLRGRLGKNVEKWLPESNSRTPLGTQDLDIDFLTILMDFGTQLGMPDPPKSV